MQDTLAELGEVHEDDMPDSRYVRPKRLTFQQAGGAQHVISLEEAQLEMLVRHSACCRTHMEVGCHTVVRPETMPPLLVCHIDAGRNLTAQLLQVSISARHAEALRRRPGDGRAGYDHSPPVSTRGADRFSSYLSCLGDRIVLSWNGARRLLSIIAALHVASAGSTVVGQASAVQGGSVLVRAVHWHL